MASPVARFRMISGIRFRLKQLLFAYLAVRRGKVPSLTFSVVQPVLIGFLRESRTSETPLHNPPALSTPALLAKQPRGTAFMSLQIAAPDQVLTNLGVRNWYELTPAALERLGGAYFALGRFHRAREALECAAVLGIKTAYYAYLLGCLYLLDDEEAMALRWLKEGARLNPGLAAPAEYFYISENDPKYVPTEFDESADDTAWLRSGYNCVGQRVLHAGGEGQLRPNNHAKAMEKQALLHERARPSPNLARFLDKHGIEFRSMHVLPWEWVNQIGHLGMLEIMLRMRQLGWWSGHGILLTHQPKVANEAMLSIFENYPDLTIISDSFDGGRFVDDVSRELVGTLRSHGMPYYAWKHPDGAVVPWHEAAAKAIVDWENSVGGYPFRDLYDRTAGAASATLEAADQAFKTWGLAPGDWYACVHVREASYIGGDKNSGQGNRNSDIEQYDLAVKYITERGGWVIKLGAPGSPPLPEMPRVVDYARGPFKSELMDIHLIRHARFFVGTTSGLANVAVSFGLPTAQVNCLTTEAQPWHSGVRFCLKPIYKADGAMLTQRELVASQWRWGLFTMETMKRYGLTSQDNSAEEILETVREVEALASGRASDLDAKDSELLSAWREALVACPHQYGASSPSIYFLQKYREGFLERR